MEERDQFFMEMCRLMATRGTCPRAQVGALIVINRRIVSTGYNGAPPGMPHCTEVGCKFIDAQGETHRGCQRTIHAEANAVAFAARYGISVEGGTAYCTYSPCLACAQLLGSAGIKRYVFEKEYRAQALDLLDDMGIEWLKLAS